MRRLLLPLVLAATAAGCASMEPGGGTFRNPDGSEPVIYPRPKPSVFTTVGNAVLSVPENAIWWPYKVVSSALRGGFDGVSDGVSQAPMPVVGVVASPLTGAAGIVNGVFHGVTRGPAWVGTTSELGSAFGKPWSEPIPLLAK